MKVHPRQRFARQLPTGASVLDVGCWNYSFLRLCEGAGVTGLQHFGVDRQPPPEQPAPAGFVFREVDLEAAALPFDDAAFDAVVLSHVIEHLTRPLALFDEAMRVLKPGGLLYVECPSERSLWIPSMPFKLEESRSLSFFDDPTHVGRPQTPQSLHRLLKMYGAEVVESAHIVSRPVQIRLPWLLLKAFWRRDAAMLEEVVWRALGFAVFAVGRKLESSSRRYVLS